MIDFWVLISAGLLVVISLVFGISASESYSTLEEYVDVLRDCSSKQAKTIISLEKRVRSLEKDIEKDKEEHQCCIISVSKMLAETDRKADNINLSVEKHMKELYDIVQRDKEEHISAVECLADKEELNVVNPKNDDANSDEDPVYRWIFPAEEPDHEKRLIIGQWYIVIGILNNPETTGIVTCEGLWSGDEFLPATNLSFDIVYAYIRKPESADVMEKVVQMALANKG